MPEIARSFLLYSQHTLTEDLSRIRKSVAALSDSDVWWRPNEASNSIGNILLHLAGNLRQWIIGGVGGLPYERDRQREFDERSHIPAHELMVQLEAAVKESCDVIGNVSDDAILRQAQIRGEDTTVLDAIYHVVEHFSMHTGQVIYASKMRSGHALDVG